MYSPMYGRTIDSDREISITTGATEGILSALMAFVEHGDEVVVMEPMFNLYLFLIAFTGGVAKHIINSPHNPIGKVFTTEDLLSVGKICVAHGLVILSDEFYERLHYTDVFPRIATLDGEIAKHTLSVGSVGKAFNTTGWRVGYLIGNEHLTKHVQNAHTLLCYPTAGPAQEAAAVGFLGIKHGEYQEQGFARFFKS